MTVFSFDRRWSGRAARGGRGFQGPIEGLPELIAACDGKEDNFTSMVKEVLQPNQISQVGHLTHPRFKVNSVRKTATAFLHTVGTEYTLVKHESGDESPLNNINIQINSHSSGVGRRRVICSKRQTVTVVSGSTKISNYLPNERV